ncbi:receptor-like protein kinase HSL1 [Ananas comosus]|uniref:non-specific serine/threonine protein kinase n=1 Tax=Ananas comosus TaxID=4615 RepID=A0A6P5G093_ANACO|nr:receptor-like protein kinase HSL1 [Ananas comosus]
MNSLSGPLPDDFFLAPSLQSVHLYENDLSGPVPPTLGLARCLADLRLFSNRLSGPLPADLGRNSPLSFVDLSENSISGEIPAGICDGSALEQLLLLDNQLSGPIPASLARCRTLMRVRLQNNGLSGEVPAEFWGLPHVWLLELAANSLSGGIAPEISAAANLSQLLISDNRFSGPIPETIGDLPNLYEFSAANNHLDGPLPNSLANLSNLGQLDLHNNSLSGELLTGIQNWNKLTQLNLAANELTGAIPPELGKLPVLNYLDLSDNLLTGEVPAQLQNLKLNQLNLSNNRLTGTLPPLYASGAYANSFLGNPGLCGGASGPCPGRRAGVSDRRDIIWILRAIFVAAAAIFVLGLVWFSVKYRSYKKSKIRIDKSKWMLTSFHKLGFSEYEIMDCLDEDNVIGSGASGKVYKAVLSNGEAVAVKKLWGAPARKEYNNDNDGFEAEVATLGKIRHKNIVKLWCCCTHKECKLLVYEYMPNGSLGDLLHSSKGGLLDWPTRYKIALDAAEGLSYLHHDCVPAIVHRDVKSNNILLDGEFGAKVADFGVAKVVGMGPKSMSVIAGSCGYIAPEYAYTLRVNEKSDIYSFGVVILELVTGRRPVDPEFGEKDLVKWVCSTLEEKGIDHVFDKKLDVATFKEEMRRVLSIGLLCASSLPINRPSMRRVVKMLLDVNPDNNNSNNNNNNNIFNNCKHERDGKLSPYYQEDASV